LIRASLEEIVSAFVLQYKCFLNKKLKIMDNFSYLTAFAVGLMGGVHCIAMCGGIVGALSFGVNVSQQVSQQASPQGSRTAQIKILIAYNFGRLSTYTLAGGLMGGLGWMASHWLQIHQLQLILQLFAALIMILLGLYLSGWWTVLVHIERMGKVLWKRIEPLGKFFLPVSTMPQAVMLGLLWGWLPCGLVYSVLIWSVSAGSVEQGALLMLCFGLGTLPNLLAMGVFANQLNQWLRKASVRQAAGSLVIAFGVWQLYLLGNL
jgi:hypothetical protein